MQRTGALHSRVSRRQNYPFADFLIQNVRTFCKPLEIYRILLANRCRSRPCRTLAEPFAEPAAEFCAELCRRLQNQFRPSCLIMADVDRDALFAKSNPAKVLACQHMHLQQQYRLSEVLDCTLGL